MALPGAVLIGVIWQWLELGSVFILAAILTVVAVTGLWVLIA